jgi:hypothetical protein
MQNTTNCVRAVLRLLRTNTQITRISLHHRGHQVNFACEREYPLGDREHEGNQRQDNRWTRINADGCIFREKRLSAAFAPAL